MGKGFGENPRGVFPKKLVKSKFIYLHETNKIAIDKIGLAMYNISGIMYDRIPYLSRKKSAGVAPPADFVFKAKREPAGVAPPTNSVGIICRACLASQ